MLSGTKATADSGCASKELQIPRLRRVHDQTVKDVRRQTVKDVVELYTKRRLEWGIQSFAVNAGSTVSFHPQLVAGKSDLSDARILQQIGWVQQTRWGIDLLVGPPEA